MCMARSLGSFSKYLNWGVRKKTRSYQEEMAFRIILLQPVDPFPNPLEMISQNFTNMNKCVGIRQTLNFGIIVQMKLIFVNFGLPTIGRQGEREDPDEMVFPLGRLPPPADLC